MKTIFLDMDGVLTDFEGRMISLYGENKNTRFKKEHWVDFILNKNFETLDMLLSAYVLLDFVGSCKINVEILSSSGGSEYHEEVTAQKNIWLKKHNIPYKANIVPGGHRKGEYAKHDTLLIDDTQTVIDNFKKCGGQVVLHNHYDVYPTIEKIKRFIK